MRIVVSDLTRFTNNDLLCLAGLTDDGRCIRPLFATKPGYLSYETCRANNILPGTILEGEFEPFDVINPPHSEDHHINGQLRNCGNVSSDQFRTLLAASSCHSVNGAFGIQLANGIKVIPPGMEPVKSIVTLRLRPENFRICADKHNDEKIKAHLRDDDGNELSFLPVTDLGFFDRVGRKQTRTATAVEATRFIQSQAELYIRLGLSRIYQSPDGRNGYWMQVNGIYTFPGYDNSIRTYG